MTITNDVEINHKHAYKFCMKQYFTFEIVKYIGICSMHDAHRLNAHGTDCVCLSVSMFQLCNNWTDFNEIQYEYSTIGGYPMVTHFDFCE
jgi:hypothetical protein